MCIILDFLPYVSSLIFWEDLFCLCPENLCLHARHSPKHRGRLNSTEIPCHPLLRSVKRTWLTLHMFRLLVDSVFTYLNGRPFRSTAPHDSYLSAFGSSSFLHIVFRVTVHCMLFTFLLFMCVFIHLFVSFLYLLTPELAHFIFCCHVNKHKGSVSSENITFFFISTPKGFYLPTVR